MTTPRNGLLSESDRCARGFSENTSVDKRAKPSSGTGLLRPSGLAAGMPLRNEGDAARALGNLDFIALIEFLTLALMENQQLQNQKLRHLHLPRVTAIHTRISTIIALTELTSYSILFPQIQSIVPPKYPNLTTRSPKLGPKPQPKPSQMQTHYPHADPRPYTTKSS